jgi:hypothetical protein
MRNGQNFVIVDRRAPSSVSVLFFIKAAPPPLGRRSPSACGDAALVV